MADFLALKDDGSKLIKQLGTEIDLFFLLGALLLLLDAYLHKGSNGQYSLLTFDWSWSSQHAVNIGAVIGFFVTFSFVMTVITPLLLLIVQFTMLLPWWFAFVLLIPALKLAFKVDVPFLGTIFVVLATAPAWRRIRRFFQDEKDESKKWRPPTDHVSVSDLQKYAYSSEKLHLLDLIDKHYAAKAAQDNKQLRRLTAGFVVAVVVNAVVGYSDRKTMVWLLFNWSTGLNETLQNCIQVAAALFGLIIIFLLAGLFRLRLYPEWIYYPPLAEELAEEHERKRQEQLEQEARYRRA